MMHQKCIIGVTLGLLVLSVKSAIAIDHSCYQCEGVGCEDPEIVQCSSNINNDKCFMRFENNSNDVYQMGCLSDIPAEGNIVELIKRKELLVCNGSNCNGYENLPQAYQCTECSSSDGDACATKPKTLSKQKVCRTIPYTHCYQRIVGNVTERGCLNDLGDNEFYNCLNSNSDKCEVCKGHGCNEDIIPRDRKRCQRCSSDADALCNTSPAASSVCRSYDENDGCVAVYENGITKRGCKTDFTCDPNSKNCQMCSDDDCNTVNIERRFKDLYGIFQDLPINCYTCSGEDCELGKPMNSNVCEGDRYQDCMTVFDANGSVLHRGCEFAVLAEHQSHCDIHPELCFKCKSNGCNDMIDPLISQECLYCDAVTNPVCLFNPTAITTTRKCTLGCVSSLYPRKSNPKVMDFVRTCFEDIEQDNREFCTADNNCVKCLDNKCNTDILPSEERLSCLHCNGDDCGAPSSKKCVGYTRNELCFMYFDNVTQSAIQMGCRSDIPDEKLKADIKQYFICDGDNCNDYKNLPEAIFCTLCDSETDVSCAVDPKQVTNQARCGVYPYTQCFTRISGDGHTKRGCLSSLPTDIFISCHDGHPDSKCRICTDNNCNNNIYPSSRQRCYRCDSSSDPNCEDDPNSLQACPIYQTADDCVTQFVKGVTRRGCGSEMSCKDLSRKNCHTCSDSGCNNVNLASKDIGKVGIFTDLPLTCFHCNSTENCSSSLSTLGVCTGNNEQTCVTAFNYQGNVIARGCSDSLENICDEEADLCIDCKSNGCNLAEKESDFIDCVFCDAITGDNCIFNVDSVKHTRKCYKSCMTALYPRTKDEHPVYELTRTCLDDKDMNDRNYCESTQDLKCKSCSGEKCNKDELGSRKSCYQCKGDECQVPKTLSCRAVMDYDQCFVQWDETGSIVEMGCKSKYDPKDINILMKAKHIWLCDEDNCNHFDNIPKAEACVLCNSKTDPKCSVNPSSVTSSTTCSDEPYTQCYSRVLENSHTERGCISNLEDDEFLDCYFNKNSTKCLSCVGNKCNQEPFPSNRSLCHVCSSTTSVTCESKPDESQICLLYSENDKCVTSLDVNGNTLRGCSSQLTCDSSEPTTCQECEGDSCNVVNLKRKFDGKPGQWQSLPLTCLSCNNLEDCSTRSSQQLCSNSEYCMNVFDIDGKVVRRGCSKSVENDKGAYCDSNSSKCFNCNSNLCNEATSLNSYVDCIYCDSATNSECTLNPLAISNRRKCNGGCMTALYSSGNSSAFELVRTCLNDKDTIDQIACSDASSSDCKACLSSDCNTQILPEKRLSCYHCIGDNCEDPTTRGCSKYNSNDKCFILFNNISNIVQMGCLTDLSDEFVLNNLHLLHTCNNGDNCNSFDSLPKPNLCALCNSVDDEDCASNPENIPSVVICSALPNTQCFTKLNKDGSTQRGCVNSLAQAQIISCLAGNNSECAICEGDKCNIEIYPADRRRCHRCNTKDSPDCENSPEFASVCPIYSSNQFCATQLVNGHTYRGCSTEIQCDESDRQYCRLCYDSDNCNVVDLVRRNVGYPGNWQDLPLSCYHCEGNECSAANGVVKKCEGNNLQTCMTVFNSDGVVVKRGCSDVVESTHLDYCDKNSDKCFACKSNECNNVNNLSAYVECYVCDSTNSDRCATNFDSAKTRTRMCHKSCMVALYPRTSAIDPSYVLSRSCLDDLESDDREACANGDKELCKACDDSRCNFMAVPDERFECYKCIGDDCEDMESKQCNSYHANDQCYILYDNESSIIDAGCRSEFEIDVATELVKRKLLLLCNEKNCNNPPSFPTSKFCSVCNSAENPLCATNPNLVNNIQRCTHLPYTECFVRINSYGHTERGCLASLENEAFYGCLMNTDGLCETCIGDKCNEIDVFPSDRRKCYQCSSVFDPECASKPNSNKVCEVYKENDKCVINYHKGITTRGCASNVKCANEKDPRTCRLCFENGCNTMNLEKLINDGIPGRWQDIPLTCYTCKGEEDCKSKGELRSCQNNDLQNCMTVFDDKGNVIQRDCSDSIESDNKSYCEENLDKCLRCNSNGCNEATKLEEYIKCLSCDTDTNGDCVSNVTGITKTRLCRKYCMTALYPLFKEENPSYGLSRSCYDDMDLKDRELCEAGDKEYCQVCSGAKCNIIGIPQKRHSCYICEGDHCQDLKTKECSTYRSEDQCYIRFDERNSIVAFGCRSEFSNSEAEFLLKEKRLYLCDGENCNHFDNIPSAQTCVLCNSRTDSNCAVNASAVTSKTSCNIAPITDCYSRVLPDGSTERGCLSNLYDNEFLGCLNGTSTTCKTCKEDNCNNKVFPETRLICHVCDSSVDPTCESSPSSLSICLKYNSEDTCVTAFRNNVTYRGCGSSLVCDVTSPRTCVICSDEGCNTVNLAKKQDDNFGKWQDLPLTCLNCIDSKCNSESTTESLTCKLNNEQDCMIVFDKSEKVIRRGCSDIVEKEYGNYCNENEDNCFSCKSNNCNNATTNSDYTECIYCNSYRDQDCVWNPLSSAHMTRKCQRGCMTALFPSDSSSTYDIIRTCLDDKEAEDQNTCLGDKDTNCKACSSSKCNTDTVPDSRVSCFTCKDDSCSDPISKMCPLYKENDQCFIQFDDTNSVIEMGCVSSFRNQDLVSIIKTKRVYVCQGSNCNYLRVITRPKTCAVCSSVDDKSCAINPLAIGTFKTCNMLPYTYCYSKLTEAGTTQRGCLTDLPDDKFANCVLGDDENCGLCNQNGCNREIFPAGRQQCFTCTSEEEPECESFPATKLPCPTVSEEESCVTALSGNVTVRGCKSSIYCDANDIQTCRSCFGSECNSIDLINKQDDNYHGIWQDLPLMCHTCEGEHCLHSLGPTVTCSSRNINQDCITVFDELGNVERRGCSDDVEDYKDLYCRLNPERCFKCKSNECNVAWSMEDYVNCTFCDSSSERFCILNPDYSDFKSRKCYKQCMVAMKGQNLIRSCLDDKEMWVQHQCKLSGSKECAICSESNCNKFNFPEDRLICHVCTNSSCSSSITQNCERYESGDYCFAKYENGLIDLMGCASAQDSADLEKWLSEKKLYKCEGNDCNQLALLPKNGECLSCNSSKTTNCAQNPLQVTTTETCLAPNEQCYATVDRQGHTIRGCLSSIEDTNCDVSGTCSICTGAKCNSQVYPVDRLQCHMCDSLSDKNCAQNPSNMQVCPIYDKQDSCVSTLDDDGLLRRGCNSEIKCSNTDSNYCNICNTNGCNTVELKGSATVSSSNLLLTVFLSFVSLLALKF